MKLTKTYKLIILISFLLGMAKSQAVDINGGGQISSSIQSIYYFNEAAGQKVLDRTSNTPQIHLSVENESAVNRINSYIQISQDTVIASDNPATRIASALNASNEFTIELWIKNNRTAEPPPDFGADPKALTIFSISRSSGEIDLRISQFYESADVYQIDVGNETVLTNAGIVNIGSIQHIVMTKDKDGLLRLFVGNENSSPLLLQSFNLDNNLNINANSHITFGNTADYSPTASTLDRLSWKGNLYLAGVFSGVLSEEEITGIKPVKMTYPAFNIDPNKVITAEHEKALLLYKRLVGVGTPIDNPVIDQMANLISAGNMDGAASVATAQSAFYNITVRDFATRMSTRDETVNTELNDFVATIIGATRDQLDARTLLTGNYYYAADTTKAPVPNSMINDILKSNSHYQTLDNERYDLSQVLKKYDGQKLYNGKGAAVENPDPAGLLTSRAFMAAHAVAGTNRRLVEFAFREFLCVPMEKWSDATGPDNMIGMDVDRFPGGDHNKFMVSCRTCHSNMDGLRPAFAKFTFSAGFVKNAFIMPDGQGGDDESTMAQDPVGVAAKYNQNNDVFPGGFKVENTNFVNNANRGDNANYFGWGNELSGKGVQSFGKMLSEAQAFPNCMAKRAFRSVCKREPASADAAAIQSGANSFKSSNYNLRKLFERIATRTECIGQ